MIKAANEALTAQGRAIEIRDLRIKQDEDQLKNVTEENSNLKASAGRWYNSKWLWIAVGAGTALFLERKI